MSMHTCWRFRQRRTGWRCVASSHGSSSFHSRLQPHQLKTSTIVGRRTLAVATAIAILAYSLSPQERERENIVARKLAESNDIILYKGGDRQHGYAVSRISPSPQLSTRNHPDGSGDLSWSGIGDKITSVVLPDWAKAVPTFLTKLQHELSMAPGTLADEILQEASDPEISPEIIWDANVRISNDLCQEEVNFLAKRKQYTAKALARYLQVAEDEVHPEDVPTIAVCGSGGGLRALVAGTSSYAAAQKAGLFDCVTYTSGVSGSCWLQALYYSSLAGQKHEGILKHLKNRIGIHIAYPPALLKLVTSAPTNKFLLCGGYEKYMVAKDEDFGLVDIYGLLLGARLLVPKGELEVDYADLKVSNQRRYVETGCHPLPIYTSVRHEIPFEIEATSSVQEAQERTKSEAWFQWFEQTPYEFWCEEMSAGIPSWAVGRQFTKGHTIFRSNGMSSPEIRMPILMGIWGSAFCATLSHYYHEVQPILQGLTGFGSLDQLINERNEDLVKLHPIDPGQIPNFLHDMRELLPSTIPESIHKSKYLQLMDAGMSNNLPIYPLLRPGRNVDVIIVFDASADVKKDNWLGVADGYARQRQIKGWPIGTGWPASTGAPEEAARELDAADKATAHDAHKKILQAEFDQKSHTHKEDASHINTKGKDGDDEDLSYCTIWVGTTSERKIQSEPPLSTRVAPDAEDWRLMEPDAGITIIYFPFLANPNKVEGVDPMKSDFMSTWNFVYTPEQVDKVAQLAEANFQEGEDATKRTVRAIWERKRKQRLAKVQEQEEQRKRWRVRLDTTHLEGQGDPGDHFS